MIYSLSLRMAKKIKKAVPEHPRSIEVLQYAISFMLNTVSIISFTLLISIFTGNITAALFVLTGFAILRQTSGGLHLKSGLLCIIFSTLALSAITFVNFDSRTLLLVNFANLLLAGFLAPSITHKPVTGNQRAQLKILSLLIVSSNFIFSSPALGTAFLAQCLTLFPRRKEKK